MIRAVVFDIDGVLTIDGEPISGAAGAILDIERRGLPFRLLTNTTVRSRGEVGRRLASRGFPVDSAQVLTPAHAAFNRLERLGHPPVALFARPEIRPDLSGARLVGSADAEIVLLGDLGDAFNYHLLQEIFERLTSGITLWALHKSAYWMAEGKIRLDLGSFVAALEYATGREAVILGKPSPEAFLEAARHLGVPPHEIVMVGDDVRSDVAAAQAVGMRGVLVRTGKFREALVAGSGVRPDAVLDSVADLPKWLDRSAS